MEVVEVVFIVTNDFLVVVNILPHADGPPMYINDCICNSK
jgi:hypothetical protein